MQNLIRAGVFGCDVVHRWTKRVLLTKAIRLLREPRRYERCDDNDEIGGGRPWDFFGGIGC
jgi:hypothetical protein